MRVDELEAQLAASHELATRQAMEIEHLREAGHHKDMLVAALQTALSKGLGCAASAGAAVPAPAPAPPPAAAAPDA